MFMRNTFTADRDVNIYVKYDISETKTRKWRSKFLEETLALKLQSKIIYRPSYAVALWRFINPARTMSLTRDEICSIFVKYERNSCRVLRSVTVRSNSPNWHRKIANEVYWLTRATFVTKITKEIKFNIQTNL